MTTPIATVPLPVEAIPPAIALTLVEAMVGTSDTPLLLLDGGLAIVAVSTSFCIAFDLECPPLRGIPVYAMGAGEWELPRLRSLLDAVVVGGAEIASYEIDLPASAKRGVRNLVLNAHLLAYDNPGTVRVLVSVADQTDARAAKARNDQLLADKLLLNRELQHRVANSLQIIASVLMQSAMRVRSEETRAHLHQAHNRVISIAEVQRQLATTGEDEVALAPYLTQLCASIAASMIPDPSRLKLEVKVDDSRVSSDTSVSLGLIVTELVINALKHAFSDDRGGAIKVSYAGGEGDEWTLEVVDNGIGMPANDAPATPGLGTSIVEALVRQQRAHLTMSNAHPGTKVLIRHAPSGGTGAEIVPLIRAV